MVAFALVAVGRADVLPEDRTDCSITATRAAASRSQGPSVLVRKKFGDSVSLSYQYYVDMISSASIDVVTQASTYKERRTQRTSALDYLHGNTLYSVGYISSNEPDYNSKTALLLDQPEHVRRSDHRQLRLYTRGWDVVGKVEQGHRRSRLPRRRRSSQLDASACRRC